MIVRKLRLKRGWSQEQLASLTGLNIRTIQRIEHGQTPSLESKKSFASVFEVELATFDEDKPFENESGQSSNNANKEVAMQELNTEVISKEEEYVMKYVEGIKSFYSHLMVYIPFVLLILYNQGAEQGVLLGLAGWTVGIILHGMIAYEKLNVLSPQWEKN